MRTFEFTVLGSNSALPTTERNPSAHVLNVHERFYLIDCGEGTQMQIRKYGIKLQRIDQIFISHLHGDHVFGLPGLLGTLHLLGRTKELAVYSPPGLEEIIRLQHDASDTHLNYALNFVTIDTKKHSRIFETDSLEVYSIPMQHRIPCCGFLFRERIHTFNIRKEKIEELGLGVEEIRLIRSGADHRLKSGEVVPNAELTQHRKEARSFAFCSDTRPSPIYEDAIRDVDLLYHEATFLDELKDKAKKTWHTTAKEAGMIARKANAGRLIIGHFSSRYGNPPLSLLEEARGIFPETVLAEEGKCYSVLAKDLLRN